MSGLELLTTLKKLKYPGVEKLDAISLDWIFEDQEQLPFLEWFCKNVNEDNILSQEEIERYTSIFTTKLYISDFDMFIRQFLYILLHTMNYIAW